MIHVVIKNKKGSFKTIYFYKNFVWTNTLVEFQLYYTNKVAPITRLLSK